MKDENENSITYRRIWIHRSECNRIFYIKYYYYQIGLTQEWLQEISAKIGDPLTVRREILLQRLHGSSLSPFDQEDIDEALDCDACDIY